MKAIFTLRNDDGTYDEVGMSKRTVLGPYKRRSYFHVKALDLAKGRGYRLELFAGDNLHTERVTVEYVPPTPEGMLK